MFYSTTTGALTPDTNQQPDFLDLAEQPRLTHRQKCINYAQEFLASLGAEAFWNDDHFKAYYRKHNGSNANAYFFGLDVADYIIREAGLRILKG